MRKVEELTGRNLASARDRMEFFLALRARDLLASDEGATTGKALK
jgi:purine catabolism regulator